MKEIITLSNGKSYEIDVDNLTIVPYWKPITGFKIGDTFKASNGFSKERITVLPQGYCDSDDRKYFLGGFGGKMLEPFSSTNGCCGGWYENKVLSFLNKFKYEYVGNVNVYAETIINK